MAVLVGISEGKRPVGRHRYRGLHNVKKNLKGMGWNRAWHRSSDWQPEGTAVNIWFHRMRRISRLAEDIYSSGGMCSVELDG
jgi:hypothetical protein